MNSGFYTKLANRVYENDIDNQMLYLEMFASKVRNMPLDTLLKYKTFFVPDDFYLYDMSDGLAQNPKYGLYYGDKCIFSRRMVTPLPDFMGNVGGFVGYDDGSDLDDSEKDTLVKYIYLGKDVFEKGRYMFITPEEYLKARKEKYIAIVDGIYDKEMLSTYGVNATSLLGTNLTDYHKYYLKEIPYWIVPYDADGAGVDLYRYAKYLNNNTVALKFLGTKDIDEKLKQHGAVEKLINTIHQMKREGFKLDACIDFDEMGNVRKVPLVREKIIIS